MNQKMTKKWMNQYYENESALTISLLIVIAVAFVLSDWLLGAFTFTEYILGATLMVSFITGKFRIYRYQLKVIIVSIILIVFHSTILISLGNEVDFRVIMISLVKLTFYLIVIFWIINLVNDLKLKNNFLFIINCFSVVIFLIGIYIALAFYLNLNFEIELPYEFLLRFTRVDGHLFRRDVPIVRMKSIFEEPAHLGYYFNSVLMTNVFGNQRIRFNWLFNSVLILGIVLSFSYSAIAILLIILSIKTIVTLFHREFKFSINFTFIAACLSILVIIFAFRDVLYTTFISRTLELVSGTETSGYERLFDSWRYVSRNDLVLGLGFMQTPGSLWNNFAYYTTEFGLAGLIGVTVFTLLIFSRNKGLGIMFLFMNFAKGGYLSSSYWFLLLLILLYSKESETLSYIRKEEHFEIK